MPFQKFQTVIVKTSEEAESFNGTIVDISPQVVTPSGTTSGRNACKVRYTNSMGSNCEQWFRFDQLQPYLTPAEQKKAEEELAKKIAEAEADKPRKDTKWFEKTKTEIMNQIANEKTPSGVIKGTNTAQSHDQASFGG